MPVSHSEGGASEGLVRAIGRWSLVALTVNCILGSGIFGLPSQVANLLGRASPWAVLLAGAAMAVIMACYAEVSSQFAQTGGTYIYCREAFGRFTGLQVGWMMMLSRLTACAANVNLLVIYLGEFWPGATQPIARFAIISLLLGVLLLTSTIAACVMERWSAIFSLLRSCLPLAMVALAGGYYLATHSAVPQGVIHAGVGAWRTAMLLLFFAYGGYEAAMNPMGEARNPKRDAPFALFVALAIVTLVYYALIQWVVIGVLPAMRPYRPSIGRASPGSCLDMAARRWSRSPRWFRCMAISMQIS